MTPEFSRQIAEESLLAAKEEPASIRLALSAVALTDMVAAHLFWSDLSQHRRQFGLTEAEDDTHFRGKLAECDDDFKLLRDIAKAQKHVRLTRGTPLVDRADRVQPTSTLFCAPFGTGVFGEAVEVIVTTNSGRAQSVNSVVENALRFLDQRFFPK